MTYCQFEVIGRTNDAFRCICLRCLRHAELPVADIKRVKRRCVIKVVDGLQRYACWDPDNANWRYRWYSPSSVPKGCEECQEDRSLVGSRLAKLFERFGDWKNLECGCRELEGQLNAANLQFIQQHRLAIAKLIQASAERGGVKVKLSPLRAAVKIAIFQEKRRLKKLLAR